MNGPSESAASRSRKSARLSLLPDRRGALAALLGAAWCAAAAVQAQDICRLQDPSAQRLAAYSTAVAAQGLVFVSGVVPVVPETGKLAGDDIESQVQRALANLERSLALAGSGRDDVVKVTVFLKNPADFSAMNRLYATFFGSRLPARTTVPGVDWGNAFLVEIEAVAIHRRVDASCPKR